MTASFLFPGYGQTTRKQIKTAVLDRRAQFDCSVKSPNNAAQVEIWWQFQDKNVPSHAVSVTKEADGTVLSQLTIDRVTWTDGGTYSCLAREINGGESANLSVSKQEVQLDIYGMCAAYSRNSKLLANINATGSFENVTSVCA